jgi:protein-S-isoprenylcysteine O-methyltransferase Ste14
MHTLELKVPPVFVVLVAGVLMWIVAWAVPSLDFRFAARNAVAAIVVCAGALICLCGVVSFRRAHTTVNPLKPESATSLVVAGIYKLTRNPMYLGLLLALLGWAISLSNVLSFVWLPAFILYMNRFQIAPEERALAALFGPTFEDYKARTRRWI